MPAWVARCWTCPAHHTCTEHSQRTKPTGWQQLQWLQQAVPQISHCPGCAVTIFVCQTYQHSKGSLSSPAQSCTVLQHAALHHYLHLNHPMHHPMHLQEASEVIDPVVTALAVQSPYLFAKHISTARGHSQALHSRAQSCNMLPCTTTCT
jgi:hypothetical protein